MELDQIPAKIPIQEKRLQGNNLFVQHDVEQCLLLSCRVEGDVRPAQIQLCTGARRDAMAVMEQDRVLMPGNRESGMSLPHGCFPALVMTL